MKRRFGGAPGARYMTRTKVEAKMTLKAVAMNLLKAVNRLLILAIPMVFSEGNARRNFPKLPSILPK